MIKEIKKELLKVKDSRYQSFSSSLLPGVENILGVKLPVLRKIASRIIKNDYESFLKENDDEFMELTLIEAMVIGQINIDWQKKLKLIKNFIPKITNWSICDCFVASIKEVKNHKKEFKKFLEPYLASKKEYELRFSYVILLNYYIDDEFNYVMDNIIKFDSDLYYAKMAAAWCLSYCFIKNFDETISILKDNKIHSFALKKGITKARESYRLTREQKALLKKQFLKKKIL